MAILKRAEIKEFRKKYLDKRIVFTNGCFDLLHIGHIRYLNDAKKLGDILFVGINSDASVKQLKGSHRPIQNEHDRAEILVNLKAVDFVSIFDEATPLELIRLVHPQVLVKGGDWNIDKIVGADLVQSWGGRVYSLNFIDGYSTTRLIEKSQLVNPQD